MATKQNQKQGSRAKAGQSVKVKVSRRYYDTLLNKVLETGHEMKVTPERANVLQQAKVAVKK